MIKKILMMCLALALSITSFSQQSNVSENQVKNNNSKKVYVGVGFGFGVFYPGDVNDYLSDVYAGYDELMSYDMYMFYTLKFNLTYRVAKMFDVRGLAELGFSPKYIISNGSMGNVLYMYTRKSIGLTGNFNIPMGKHSLFLGGGPLLHSMKFEHFSGSTLSPRVQGGFSFNFGKFNPQVYLAVDIAKAKDDMYNMELNYSGAHLGISANF